MVLPATGSYPASWRNSLGCDPTDPPLTENITAEICQGQTYDFNGQTLTQSGIYTTILTSVEGCDSLLTLDLTVLPALNEYLTAEICYGQSYNFIDDFELTESATYTEVLTSVDGCDSIVTLELTVLPPVEEETIKAIICGGGGYEFYGQLYKESGTYTMSAYNSQGCVVIYTLELTVLPEFTTDLDIIICEGESYIFPGSDTELTSSGIYTEVFTSSTGCDSIVYLSLIVEPVAVEEIKVTIEAGDSYLLPDGSAEVTTSGEYLVTLTSSKGCDSIVVVDLRVLPYPEPVPAPLEVELTDDLNGGKGNLLPGIYPPPQYRNRNQAGPSPDEVSLAVYPNPCRDQLTVEAYGSELPQAATLQLFDGKGRAVPLRANGHPGRVTVDVSQIPAGLYWIKLIQAGQSVAVAKMVKME